MQGSPLHIEIHHSDPPNIGQIFFCVLETGSNLCMGNETSQSDLPFVGMLRKLEMGLGEP